MNKHWKEINEWFKDAVSGFAAMHSKTEYPNGCATCVDNAYGLYPFKEMTSRQKFERIFQDRLRELRERKETSNAQLRRK